MPRGLGGYQPDTKSESSRRADFDLQRRLSAVEHEIAVPINWPDGYPTYDLRYVNVGGDTMTGALAMVTTIDQAITVQRAAGAPAAQGPHIAFRDVDAVRLGYLRFGTAADTAPGCRLAADANQPIRFYTGGDQFVITTADVTCNNKLTVVGPGNEAMKVSGTTTGYLALYEGGTRRGYVGHYPATAFSCWADTNYLRLGSTNSDVVVHADNVETCRFNSGWFLVQKTTADGSLGGHQFGNTYQMSTNNVVATPMITLNKVGAGVGSGHDYLHFRTNNSTIGSIQRNGSQSAVVYNTTSDYRQKDVQGPIDNGLARVERLRPLRVIWKEDESRQVVDAFLAHEVAEVIPDAVTGEKDAVATEDDEGRGLSAGDPIYQQMDYSRLVPTLVAAVQELSAEVRELRAELAELKA